MDKVLWTPRLQLTLLETLDEGSKDLEWAHRLNTDEKAMSWSIGGVAGTIEDTKEQRSGLPSDAAGVKSHHGVYFVHKILTPTTGNENDPDQAVASKTDLVGRVSFRTEKTFPNIPAEFTVPTSVEKGVLSLEVGYRFLGSEWGKGFATEALVAVLEGMKSSEKFLSPFTKLYVEAMCSHENPGSIRVLEKVGMKSLGMYSWEGEKVFLNGAMRDTCVLVHGMWLVE
ncbi:hypothetical protein E2P81_ATG06278 [Venturia nashicola]|nr:hypothetical protein E2P81_ATG06278 [Venturia nashicola]